MLSVLKKLMGCSFEKEAAALYSKAAEASKNNFFWRDLGLEKTAPMRFEVIAFHVALLLIKLKNEKALAQAIFDYMFDDFDACFREMGVSDLRVGKHIKLYAKHFYARLEVYQDDDQERIASFFEIDDKAKLEKLDAYISEKKALMETWSIEDLKQGVVSF